MSTTDREFYDAYIWANSPHYPYEVPQPGAPQCEADGVRNGPDGPGGTEHYWTCTAPGTVDVDGSLLCEDHAGERGHGPRQAEYGFDFAGRDDTHTTRDNPRAAGAASDRGAQPPGQRTGCCTCGCHQENIEPDPCVQAGQCIVAAKEPRQ